MTSEVEERPRLVTGGYGWHRHQWVNVNPKLLVNELYITQNVTKEITNVPTIVKWEAKDKCDVLGKSW